MRNSQRNTYEDETPIWLGSAFHAAQELRHQIHRRDVSKIHNATTARHQLPLSSCSNSKIGEQQARFIGESAANPEWSEEEKRKRGKAKHFREKAREREREKEIASRSASSIR